MKDNGYKYFVQVMCTISVLLWRLSWVSYPCQVLGDTSMQCEYRTMAAFAISSVVNKYPMGQVRINQRVVSLYIHNCFSLSLAVKERCLQSGVVALCLGQLEEKNPVLRQWLAICLGRLWQNFDSARWYGARDNAHEKLLDLLWDEIPDVRSLT